MMNRASRSKNKAHIERRPFLFTDGGNARHPSRHLASAAFPTHPVNSIACGTHRPIDVETQAQMRRNAEGRWEATASVGKKEARARTASQTPSAAWHLAGHAKAREAHGEATDSRAKSWKARTRTRTRTRTLAVAIACASSSSGTAPDRSSGVKRLSQMLTKRSRSAAVSSASANSARSCGIDDKCACPAVWHMGAPAVGDHIGLASAYSLVTRKSSRR
eukprot:6212263-Pleurochrysis_carterae.AAC.5